MSTTKTIDIPEWFHPEIQFRSIWISNGNNTCTLLNYNKLDNTCVVHVETPSTKFTEYDWNLQHVLWGFEQGDYILLN